MDTYLRPFQTPCPRDASVQMADNSKRTLEIVLSGEAVLDGRVSVSLFTNTLRAVQDVVIQVAKSRLQKDPAKRGPSPSVIRRECELFLVRTEPSSLHAYLELPEKEATLFPDLPDFGESVFEDTKNMLDSIGDGDERKLHSIIPNAAYRARIVNNVARIAPCEDSDYHLEYKTPNQPPRALVRPPKAVAARLVALPSMPPEKEEPTGRRRFVEAKGLAEICEGNITKWIETYDMVELELDFERAWRPREIKAERRLFRLTHPIACAIEKQERLFVSEYEPLGIVAYGESREEVMRAFSYEFAILWDVIVQESDIRLTEDAKALKKKLIELVKEVEPYGVEKDQRH